MIEDLDKKLGAKLKDAREGKSISQEVLALSTGYEQEAISRFEGGRRRIPAIAVYRICRYLGISSEELDPLETIEN